MFLNNKYTKLYYKIISQPDIEGYTENHHIIPKSLGGSNNSSNIITISARKHFLCHYLLIKMTKGPDFWKMIKAFNMMHTISDNQQRYINSRLYASMKEQFSQLMKISQSGSNNSQYGTCWVYCPYTLKSKKVPKTEIQTYLDNGCIKGRIQNVNIFISNNRKKPKGTRNNPVYTENTINKQRDQEIYYKNLYNQYISSGLSYNNFVKINNLPFSGSNLCHIFRRRGFRTKLK